MRLLVSVASAAEAQAALRGGADVIDAKDPSAGALGAVTLEVFRGIAATVAGRRPLTAAIGDAAAEAAVEDTAAAFTAAGARLVKLGFAGIRRADRAVALTSAAVRGAGGGGVVVVAYADADWAQSLGPAALIDVAARAGATGVLLDTSDKNGPGLPALISPAGLAAWVAAARTSGLAVALAGRLTAGDLPFVRRAGADIAGVRGAACDGGREGTVTADRVRMLMDTVRLEPDLTPVWSG